LVTSGPLVSGFDKHSYRFVGVSKPDHVLALHGFPDHRERVLPDIVGGAR